MGTVINMASSTMSGTRIDVSPLVGTWFGIKLDENRIAKLMLTEHDGKLLLHPYGAPGSEQPDWGEAEAFPHAAPGSTTASGFQAHLRTGAMQVEFVVIENQGVLLAQTFTSFPDDSGRPSEFAKAYYRRAAPELVSTTGLSTGALTGEWVNANPATNRVTRFTLTEDTIRIQSANDPADWGEAEITAYQDSHGDTFFHAVYDLEPFEAVIGVISVKNLVVLNEFRRPKDGESVNTVCREFFFRNQ